MSAVTSLGLVAPDAVRVDRGRDIDEWDATSSGDVVHATREVDDAPALASVVDRRWSDDERWEIQRGGPDEHGVEVGSSLDQQPSAVELESRPRSHGQRSESEWDDRDERELRRRHRGRIDRPQRGRRYR